MTLGGYLLISIVVLAPCLSSAFFVPPNNIEKCDLGDTLGLIMCISPVTSLFQNNINLMNVTRARGIRILDECRNATTCISQYKCATTVKLDKTFNLLCDAFDYFSNGFAPCQKKILAQMPPCMRNAEMLKKSEKTQDPCELINSSRDCFETEITDICGESYWTPIDKIWSKLQLYSMLKC
ncbi:unnamed protein product [Caenorhabditis sp. 36 PRJEB53466]|nr:unnamed protein product [Caenorhabditis sp. 36 PRJEB53466]